jgi:hypothetical protein
MAERHKRRRQRIPGTVRVRLVGAGALHAARQRGNIIGLELNEKVHRQTLESLGEPA